MEKDEQLQGEKKDFGPTTQIRRATEEIQFEDALTNC